MHSSETHPLLNPELDVPGGLTDSSSQSRKSTPGDGEDDEENEEALIDALGELHCFSLAAISILMMPTGTLSIGTFGDSEFFGPTARGDVSTSWS